MDEENVPIPIQFESDGGARYRVYSGILDWVCRRQVGKGLAAKVNTHLRRYLQVAGLATHQSGKRVLHWSRFSRALERSGLAQERSDIDNKAFSTILAFAFTSLEKQAWEFTHKSFGEALAAEAMGLLFEDVAEKGRYGEAWRMSATQATESWIYTFGPNFPTKDVLDFCSGWLGTKSREFVRDLIERLPDIYLSLLSSSSGAMLGNSSQTLDLSVANVLGNCVRSWFSIANISLLQYRKLDKHWEALEGQLDPSRFREGVYLCQLVSGLSPGESIDLFAHSSRLFRLPQRNPPRSVLRGQKLSTRHDFLQIRHALRSSTPLIVDIDSEARSKFELLSGPAVWWEMPITPSPKSAIEVAFLVLEDAVSSTFQSQYLSSEPDPFGRLTKGSEILFLDDESLA